MVRAVVIALVVGGVLGIGLYFMRGHGNSSATETARLANGTTLAFEDDNIYVVNADGSKTPAPDGVYDMHGAPLPVKNGKAAQQ